ncbi:MAG TPA: hypothetical protein VFO52_11590 [Longimicrobiales bacterium]|nr:hypothetical protein [Longimicrobiales bacterium]
MENRSPRTALIGALTLLALVATFILAVLTRRPSNVPVVIVAPAGTAVALDGSKPRLLPDQPNTAAGLSSYYFLTRPGEHEVQFREPGKADRVQSLQIPEGSLPVIYTLLRDTLREMRARER